MYGNPGSGRARSWPGLLSLIEGISRAGEKIGEESHGAATSGVGQSHQLLRRPHLCGVSDAGDEFFDCWGEPSRTGPDRVLICSGEGNYPVANCYRCSLEYEGKIYPDTACIGIYAVNGVCHQSANCFLFTAGVTLTFEVRGYWFTLLAYGTYGNFYTFWAKLAAVLAGGRGGGPGNWGDSRGHQSVPYPIRSAASTRRRRMRYQRRPATRCSSGKRPW